MQLCVQMGVQLRQLPRRLRRVLGRGEDVWLYDYGFVRGELAVDRSQGQAPWLDRQLSRQSASVPELGHRRRGAGGAARAACRRPPSRRLRPCGHTAALLDIVLVGLARPVADIPGLHGAHRGFERDDRGDEPWPGLRGLPCHSGPRGGWGRNPGARGQSSGYGRLRLGRDPCALRGGRQEGDGPCGRAFASGASVAVDNGPRRWYARNLDVALDRQAHRGAHPPRSLRHSRAHARVRPDLSRGLLYVLQHGHVPGRAHRADKDAAWRLRRQPGLGAHACRLVLSGAEHLLDG
mmetsp:Transcript_81319/g.226416  ORF Transcript_81319/g.226416 Transcript_81319/m.226416 type:complete len:293 (-) Transcript_81319:231-1109(-)